MLLISLAALFAATLAVSAAMATAIRERRREIGLMKAMGASRSAVAALFVSEAAVIALVAGTTGFVAGTFIARSLGRNIFQAEISVQPALLPLVLMISALILGLGSMAAIRRAAATDPAVVLRGDA